MPVVFPNLATAKYSRLTIVVNSPIILYIILVVKGPSFLVLSSFVIIFTLETSQLLVISERNNKVAYFCLLMVHSLISYSMIFPTKIFNRFIVVYRSLSLS